MTNAIEFGTLLGSDRKRMDNLTGAKNSRVNLKVKGNLKHLTYKLHALIKADSSRASSNLLKSFIRKISPIIVSL